MEGATIIYRGEGCGTWSHKDLSSSPPAHDSPNFSAPVSSSVRCNSKARLQRRAAGGRSLRRAPRGPGAWRSLARFLKAGLGDLTLDKLALVSSYNGCCLVLKMNSITVRDLSEWHKRNSFCTWAFFKALSLCVTFHNSLLQILLRNRLSSFVCILISGSGSVVTTLYRALFSSPGLQAWGYMDIFNPMRCCGSQRVLGFRF